MSENLNFTEDIEAGNTFHDAYGLNGGSSSWPERSRFIKILYFSLTTLSTVGYGDIYPVTYIEMIVTVLIMFLGVAFFSFIMSNLMEILESIEAKMGLNDKSD